MLRSLSLIVLLALALTPALAQNSAVRFNRDIRPILSENCFRCHGFDRNARKANLRLDTEDGAKALRGDHAPLVGGSLEKSSVWQRITTKELALRMPPASTGKTLKPKEIALLKRWIEQGAKWEGHWAYQPITSPTLPNVANRWGAWANNSIDRLLLTKMLSEGLTPSPEAPTATLLRRLSLDLTGLPPTPSELSRFLADTKPGAWGRAIDYYLASPHFGERMAEYWLDLVRYADTVGYHGDQETSVSPYRDYVIRAFNTNKRFDQFTREQLAGDLLPRATLEQRVASAYNKLGMMSTEGGIQDKEYRAKYAVDRVKNVSAAWLGSTLGCAECHDHKFDPFTQRDFYKMAAFFADLKEKGYYESGYTRGDWGPMLRVATPQQQAKLDQFEKDIAAAQKQIAETDSATLQSGLERWEARTLQLDKSKSLAWIPLKPTTATSSGGATLKMDGEGIVTVSGKLPAYDTYSVTLPAPSNPITAIRLDTFTDDSLPGNYSSRAGHYFALSEIEVEIQRGNAPAQRVPLRSAVSSIDDEGYPTMALIDGNPKTGWGAINGIPMTPSVVVRFGQAIGGGSDAKIVVHLSNRSAPYRHIGKFRLQASQVPEADLSNRGIPDTVLALLHKAPATRSADEQKAVLAHYRSVAEETAPLRLRLMAMERDKSLLLGEIPKTLVSQTTDTPRVVRILPRGNWMDDSGEIVQPGVPSCFNYRNMNPKLTRLDLANWLVSNDNPLTPRVFVNRVWKLLFGTGLSKSMEDFGIQGEAPLHPELLDWLANDFVKSGWDVKHLLKTILSTSAYRQSSVVRAEHLAKDPYNRYYARQSVLRLDAEFVRDVALSVGGLLNEQIGGASNYPKEPPTYLSSLNFPRREWAADTGENLYRRGLYTHWQRTFLHPSLLAFDAPSREEATCTRNVSNTPLQALVLLNDPNFVEAARGLATRMIKEGGKTWEGRIRFAFLVALARSPKPAEIKILQQLYQTTRATYMADRDSAKQLTEIGESDAGKEIDPVELATWTAIARALLNLNETITRS